MPAATRILQVNEVSVQTLNDVLRQIRDLFDNISAENLQRITFLHFETGVTYVAPGTSYLADAETQQQVDFARQTIAYGRVIVRGSGNEATAQKGVAIRDVDRRVIAEVTWNDNLVTDLYHVGAWTPIAITEDSLLHAAVKASSGTENITLQTIVLETRGVVQIKTVQR